MDRVSQLDALIASLKELVEILANDPQCQWQKHFTDCLGCAEALRERGFDQQALNELSGSVRHVFGGMGSFNDYAPVKADPAPPGFKLIDGMDRLAAVANQVYDRALELIVVDRR